MSRKQIVKLAAAISDAEVALALASYGGEWVLVGDPAEPVHVVDNNVFRRFEALLWLDDDEVWSSAKERYLLSQDLLHFATDADLREYVDGLTRSKYVSRAEA
ncbi:MULTISPECIES: hypothetical protein [unclassified Pseudoxanthomonas]|jgi:hypothetical protein|uniref:hypothetical protein n=1 Tax=unclassified Pseudoxanthomonas TaxID=2645906 RepID=UPI00307F0E69